jgi:hypothetical protein
MSNAAVWIIAAIVVILIILVCWYQYYDAVADSIVVVLPKSAGGHRVTLHLDHASKTPEIWGYTDKTKSYDVVFLVGEPRGLLSGPKSVSKTASGKGPIALVKTSRKVKRTASKLFKYDFTKPPLSSLPVVMAT